MSRLLDAAGDAPFIFVVGKGGVGKTTTAGALSLELADSGSATHLISTDPAHSLADLFQHPVGGDVATSPCSPLLVIEEFDASRAGAAWVGQALGPVTAIVEGGTYLDGEDVAAFSRLALPGLDEMMAVLRLSALTGPDAEGRRIVVDTAPTGHTLRLLDAADIHEGIARALRAMADKAAAVAGAMTGRAVRLQGESIIDDLEQAVSTYRERVLAPAAFIVASRSGRVVEAETRRLAAALSQRGLRVAAVVTTGGAGDTAHDATQLDVPLLDNVAGCDGLRRWREHVGTGRRTTASPGPPAGPMPPSAGSAQEWLVRHSPRILLFAGKGGVGKSTCAAAAALALAASRDVLLCSTDPAGSLDEVLEAADAGPTPRLRVLQIEPAAQLEALRGAYQEEIGDALARLGLSDSAALDRRVMETLWDLTPPGLDELAATAAMLEAAESGETIVIDSAPTGHFLRLLEMPDIALSWTRQLMRVFVKYGIAGAVGGTAESLLELSRDLRKLRDALHDPDSAAAVVVTLDEPLVRAETERLAASLARSEMRVEAVLLNRFPGPAPEHGAWLPVAGAAVVIHAPALDPAPTGPDALRRFVDTWNIVE